MSQAARESLALADRTQRVSRWVLVLARVVGVVGVLVLVLATVSGVVLATKRSTTVASTGVATLGGVAVALLVQAALLALLARYSQLRSADVRASRAYEAAIAGALADLLRSRDGAPAAGPSTAASPTTEAAAPGAVSTVASGDQSASVGSPSVVRPTADSPYAGLRPVEPVEPVAAAVTTADDAAWRPHSHSAEPRESTPDPAVVTDPVVSQTVVTEPVLTPSATEQAAAAAVQTAVAVAPETGLPVAGWYPDPAGPGQRWWDGLQWTTATR